MPSVERRLYDAWRRDTGVRLSADELYALIADDAMETRITNQIASENGFDEPGHASTDLFACGGSVKKFLAQLERDNNA
jgi:hypothetical protein